MIIIRLNEKEDFKLSKENKLKFVKHNMQKLEVLGIAIKDKSIIDKIYISKNNKKIIIFEEVVEINQNYLFLENIILKNGKVFSIWKVSTKLDSYSCFYYNDGYIRKY